MDLIVPHVCKILWAVIFRSVLRVGRKVQRDFSGRTSRFEGKWSPTSFVASIDHSFLFSCLNAELRSGVEKLWQEQVGAGRPAQLRAGLVPAEARLLRGGAAVLRPP